MKTAATRRQKLGFPVKPALNIIHHRDSRATFSYFVFTRSTEASFRITGKTLGLRTVVVSFRVVRAQVCSCMLLYTDLPLNSARIWCIHHKIYVFLHRLHNILHKLNERRDGRLRTETCGESASLFSSLAVIETQCYAFANHRPESSKRRVWRGLG